MTAEMLNKELVAILLVLMQVKPTDGCWWSSTVAWTPAALLRKAEPGRTSCSSVQSNNCRSPPAFSVSVKAVRDALGGGGGGRINRNSFF